MHIEYHANMKIPPLPSSLSTHSRAPPFEAVRYWREDRTWAQKVDFLVVEELDSTESSVIESGVSTDEHMR